MQIGLSIFATEVTIHPVRLAREAEARGFESLFFPEHTHIPASRKTPYPLGGELPPEYHMTHDPFVGLAQAAAVTERLKVGTGICLVPEHDPIVLAKTVASLDRLSGGRFLFGVGAGWNAEELENHGGVFAERWKVLEDRIQAMKAIWTEETASYHGTHSDFDAIWSKPKPHQKPHPPVLIGAQTRVALKRVVRYGDGWFPINGTCRLERRIPELHELAEKAGRDPASFSITLFGAIPDAGQLEKVRELGVTRAVFALPQSPESKTLELLDRYAPLVGLQG